MLTSCIDLVKVDDVNIEVRAHRDHTYPVSARRETVGKAVVAVDPAARAA
jgi:hypothetical protein